MNTTETMNAFKKLENPAHYKFETVKCYECGADDQEFFLVGQDDLTGRPGNFQYVKCNKCGLAYQNPRIDVSQIKDFYDDEYIAHRKKKDWGALTPVYEWAMNKHDRDKDKLVSEHVKITKDSTILDVGCAVGTFIQHMRNKYGCTIHGVDFKDLRGYPGFENIHFHNGLFYEQDFGDTKFDLITMWHFLEHDYDPNKTIKKALSLLKPNGKLVIEVPRLDSVTFKLYKERWPGVQAPQHTILFDKQHFISFLSKHNLKIEQYMPYGAFPSYFYIYTGAAFKRLKGKGLNLDNIIVPYFTGQLLLSPVLMLEKKLNLSMQTVVCSLP